MGPPAGSHLLVGTAIALIQAAASAARSDRRAGWDPLGYLHVAADRAWGTSGGAGAGGWRTDPTGHGADFRLALLLAEAACARSLHDGGYLSGGQLALDLRRGAAWLAAGLPYAEAAADG
jgi:hypothetical protein